MGCDRGFVPQYSRVHSCALRSNLIATEFLVVPVDVLHARSLRNTHATISTWVYNVLKQPSQSDISRWQGLLLIHSYDITNSCFSANAAWLSRLLSRTFFILHSMSGTRKFTQGPLRLYGTRKASSSSTLYCWLSSLSRLFTGCLIVLGMVAHDRNILIIMMFRLSRLHGFCTQKLLKLSDIHIPREKLEVNFCRSSGPGGQNVNKTNSKAEIRFNVDTADWIDARVKSNLRRLYENMISREGHLIVTSQVERSQGSNLEDCFDKLRQIILRCSQPEKQAFVIPPPSEFKLKERIEKKRHKSEIKQTRKQKFND